MSRGVNCSAEEEHIFCERGVQEFHGSHPPTTVDEDPLCLRGWDEVGGIHPPQLRFHKIEGCIVAFVYTYKGSLRQGNVTPERRYFYRSSILVLILSYSEVYSRDMNLCMDREFATCKITFSLN